MSYALIASKSR